MKRDTIKSLAIEIKDAWPELEVEVLRGYCNTGKGRIGTRIIVKDVDGELLLDHNNAETYRRTYEVRNWMEARELDEAKNSGETEFK